MAETATGPAIGTLIKAAPDHPGWHEWCPEGVPFNDQVLAPLLLRLDSPEVARLRVLARPFHSNAIGSFHGGVMLALIDVALFAGPTMILGRSMLGGVTIQLNHHFTGGATVDDPVDAAISITRETGKLIFIQGRVEQDEAVVGSFSGIIEKPR